MYFCERSLGDTIRCFFFPGFSALYRILLVPTVNRHRWECESHAFIHWVDEGHVPDQERVGPPKAVCPNAKFTFFPILHHSFPL